MKRKYLQHSHTVFQWFSTIFIIISLIFCLALVPLFLYLQNTFTNLQLEKSRQQLNTGISEIEAVTADVLNISQLLLEDSRFLPLRYRMADYSALPANTRLQLKNTFSCMMLPIDSVFHAALQIEENVALAKNSVYFEGLTCYYPDFFSVNDLEYEAWVQLLSEHRSDFLPICSVRLNGKEYEALIFSAKWTNNSCLYACIETNEVKRLILGNDNQSNCYFTITRLDGTLLYSDLPDTESDYQTLSGTITTGGLEISIHIPDSIFYRKMQPLYFFLGIYALLCVIMLVIISLMGTRFSAKPFIDIIHTLEGSRNIPVPEENKTTDQQHTLSGHNLKSGFDYISRSILSADMHLGEYQSTIHTQQKILQTRFLEKALTGQLASPREISQFYSYFPDFPQGFCLVLIRLETYAEEETPLYSDPLLILQSFLQSELPKAYQQQISDSELLLLIGEEYFEAYRKTLDFVVKNVNREEPAYMLRCIASRIYHHLEKLPAAYRQILDMDGLSFSGNQTQVCTVDDCVDTASPRTGLAMTELMTLYTAITYGNQKMALSQLQTYSEELSRTQNPALHKSVYEMIQTILNCIKQEHPLLFIDEHVPAYSRNLGANTSGRSEEESTLYAQLSEVVIRFCDHINESKQSDMDPFVKEVIQYIDAHYTEYDLCLTTLMTHFQCASSTIRKAFKNETNITVSSYIEQKRMKQANELLAQNQLSITEIALQCGFSNSNSFYKAYRRVYGHAPTMQGADISQ